MKKEKGKKAPTPPERAPEIQAAADRLAVSLSGRTQAQAMAERVCPTCGKPVGEFRDAESRGEYHISGMCQACQDSVF